MEPLLDPKFVATTVADVLAEEGYPLNCAIAAARITTVALSNVGISCARAVACQLDAFNPATLEMLRSAAARGISPAALSPAEQARWQDDGAVWVSLVDASPGPGYSGHVVTLLADDWLIDPTLGQASRPDRGMALGPMAFKLDRAEQVEDALVVNLDAGTSLVYRLEPSREDFRSVRDWRDVDLELPTIARVVSRLRGGMTADARRIG